MSFEIGDSVVSLRTIPSLNIEGGKTYTIALVSDDNLILLEDNSYWFPIDLFRRLTPFEIIRNRLNDI